VDIGANDWPLLGNIGQAYGGVSAVLSSLALIGIAASTAIQARQQKAEHIAIVRSFQLSLYDLARENPELCWPVVAVKYSGDGSKSAKEPSAYSEGYSQRCWAEAAAC